MRAYVHFITPHYSATHHDFYERGYPFVVSSSNVYPLEPSPIFGGLVECKYEAEAIRVRDDMNRMFKERGELDEELPIENPEYAEWEDRETKSMRAALQTKDDYAKHRFGKRDA